MDAIRKLTDKFLPAGIGITLAYAILVGIAVVLTGSPSNIEVLIIAGGLIFLGYVSSKSNRNPLG